MRHVRQVLAAVAAGVTITVASGTVQAQDQPTLSEGLQRSFASVSGFLLRSAEMMPENKYGYRATADTRTFGEEIRHVADAHYFFCARGKGEAPPPRGPLADASDKTQLLAILRASIDFCTAAYASATDSTLLLVFQLGQARGVRGAPLANNIAHDNEHYGKVVTLLRLNGLVPPSSQR